MTTGQLDVLRKLKELRTRADAIAIANDLAGLEAARQAAHDDFERSLTRLAQIDTNQREATQALDQLQRDINCLTSALNLLGLTNETIEHELDTIDTIPRRAAYRPQPIQLKGATQPNQDPPSPLETARTCRWNPTTSTGYCRADQPTEPIPRTWPCSHITSSPAYQPSDTLTYQATS